MISKLFFTEFGFVFSINYNYYKLLNLKSIYPFLTRLNLFLYLRRIYFQLKQKWPNYMSVKLPLN